VEILWRKDQNIPVIPEIYLRRCIPVNVKDRISYWQYTVMNYPYHVNKRKGGRKTDR
jgi:hypothetical protein